MATMRELKRRITSVHSSQKITGAMKMISSARLRKAENALNRARPYQEQLKVLLNHITEADCDYRSPFSQERKVKRVTLVVYASDEGLCGSFNVMLLKKLEETIQEYRKMDGVIIEVYPIGRKIVNEVRKIRRIEVKSAPLHFEKKEYVEGVTMLAEQMMSRFVDGDTDRVEVIYTRYKSIGTQILSRAQILPLLRLRTEQAAETIPEKKKYNYIYEPDCETIFKELYPLIIRTMFYKALLENQTSEQAVRILSMQMANDNAVKLLGSLQLEYNKLRQQGITSELLDMAGGSIQQ